MRKIYSVSTVLSLLTFATNGCSRATADQAATQNFVAGSEALESAHMSFINKDYKAMGLAIKEVLQSDGEPEVKENALNLLSATYDENCGYNFPVDWQLPDQINWMMIDVGRSAEPDKTYFKTKFRGHLKEADGLEQLRVVLHPDQVIVDKAAGIGDWYLEVNPSDPSDIYFELSDKEAATTKVKPGLYLLDIVTKGGKQTKGWFILNDQFASATPVLHSPAVGERFSTASPTFRWDDFRSPEYKPCEKRRLGIYVTKLPAADDWLPLWSLAEKDPGITSAVVGTDGEGSTLSSGRYWLSLFYRESRNFGDLEIRRQAATARQFYVD